MNDILIIGNGFDLAHGLPTQYADFLEFSKRFCLLFKNNPAMEDYDEFKQHHIDSWKGNEQIKNGILDLFKLRESTKIRQKDGRYIDAFTLKDRMLDSFFVKLEKNIWYHYLLTLYENKKMRGVNWIDFKSEISGVIQIIDAYCNNLEEDNNEVFSRMQDANEFTGKISLFYSKLYANGVSKTLPCEKFINRLYDDLEAITEALGIYLYKFVEKISIRQDRLFVNDIQPDYIISFNYTHTYQRLYDESIPVCYIHGECKDTERDVCDMVLGIDEYLDEDERSTNTNMAIFKKFVQRIRKRNDTQYRIWHDEMEMSYERNVKMRSLSDEFDKDVSDVYVYGHSLDVTDRDVLELFLSPEYCSLHIYAKRKTNEGRLICNLIKIMKEDVLIKKSVEIPSKLDLEVLL